MTLRFQAAPRFQTAAAVILALAAATVRADYEAPLPQYDPGTYYSGIDASNVSTLESQLSARVNNGFVRQSYTKFGTDWAVIDRDPNNSANVIEIYTRTSTPAGSNTLNREHQWVNSRLPNDAANDDYFNLRPLNSSVNSTRSNYNYTSTRTSDGKPGLVTVGGTKYWYPGDADRGDTARALFYMAVKYDSEITLVNGAPMTTGVNEMGDLASLLKNNYVDGIDNFERRRNVNVQSYQKNRNPFVDHPEYVWAIFGGGNNDSQLSVGTPAANGASSASVNLGTVIKGATLGTGSVTLNKTGADPTTLDITTSGSATTAAAGVGQTFDYGTQSRTLSVGLSSGTATAGLKSGSITIDNTDLTNDATGHGSSDGNDTISVAATVLDHANASFSNSADVNTKALSLGTFEQGSGTKTLTLANLIYDLSTTTGYTAGLDLDSISGQSGDLSKLGLSGSFTNLAESSAASLLASIDLSTAGLFSATYTLGFSDQNLPGATSANSKMMTLTLSGSVVAVPEPAALAAVMVGGLAILRRRRRVDAGA
ncbi:MAG: endonuclease [Tepidisphaeraceae bacterium]